MSFQEYTSALTVQAEQIEGEPRSIITPQGAVTGYAGQWEVRYPDGNVRVVDDEEFLEDFDPDRSHVLDDDDEDEDEDTTSSSPAEEKDSSNEGSGFVTPAT